MESLYGGFCGECGERYPEGTEIIKKDGQWVHKTCPEVAALAAAFGICDKCFMALPATGKCGCDE